MKALARLAEWFVNEPRIRADRDRYEVAVVSPAGEQFDRARLPFELRYACDHLPGAEDRLRSFFARGYGLGIRIVPHASPAVLSAAHGISSISQEGTVEPWLSRLIFREEIPVFSDDDLAEANARGCHLLTAAHVILSDRNAMIRIVPVDLEARGLDDADAVLVSDVNRAIEPLSAAYLHHRILLDRRAASPSPVRLLATTGLLVAPAACLAGFAAPGLSLLAAALADDILRESSALVLLRASGCTPRQVLREGIVYAPVLLIAIAVLVAANAALAAGSVAAAGFLFGLAAVSFPCVRLIQEIAERRSAYYKLHATRKVSNRSMPSVTGMAVRDVFVRPDAGGRLAGILTAPFISALAFAAFSRLAVNGWFLAFIASLDLFIAIAWLYAMRAAGRALFVGRVRRIAAQPSKEAAFRVTQVGGSASSNPVPADHA